MSNSGEIPIERGMVLAAGLGTRMRHLTSERPKPLVTVAGRTLLDRALDKLAAAGVGTVVVNVHYLADQIEAALAARDQPRVVVSNERDRRLETGGGVARALPLLGPGPFLVQNADCFWIEGMGSNIARLVDMWDDERMDALLMLAGGAQAVGYEGRGDFLMDGEGRIARRPERQLAPFLFAGVSIAHPRLFRDTPKGAFSLNVVWDRAISEGRAYGMRMEGLWMHVGTPEALVEAEQRLREEAGA